MTSIAIANNLTENLNEQPTGAEWSETPPSISIGSNKNNGRKGQSPLTCSEISNISSVVIYVERTNVPGADGVHVNPPPHPHVNRQRTCQTEWVRWRLSGEDNITDVDISQSSIDRSCLLSIKSAHGVEGFGFLFISTLTFLA